MRIFTVRSKALREPIAWLFCLLLLSPSVASAQNTDRVAALSKQAMTAFTAGRHDRAVKLYLKAFALDDDAALLYNIAFIREKRQKLDEAREFYKRVTTSARATPELKVLAYQRLELLEKAKPVALLGAAAPTGLPKTAIATLDTGGAIAAVSPKARRAELRAGKKRVGR